MWHFIPNDVLNADEMRICSKPIGQLIAQGLIGPSTRKRWDKKVDGSTFAVKGTTRTAPDTPTIINLDPATRHSEIYIFGKMGAHKVAELHSTRLGTPSAIGSGADPSYNLSFGICPGRHPTLVANTITTLGLAVDGAMLMTVMRKFIGKAARGDGGDEGDAEL